MMNWLANGQAAPAGFSLALLRGLVVLLTGLQGAGAVGEDSLPSRDLLVKLFAHREDLVESVDAEMYVEELPSSEELVSDLKRRYSRFASDYYKRYVIPSDRSYRERWYRSGIKERSDRTNGDKVTTSFDGATVRAIDYSQRMAQLDTRESASWDGSPILDPLSLLYEFRTRRLSDIFAEGRDFDVTRQSIDGNEVTRVVVSNPGLDDFERFVFYLNDQLLPVRRDFLMAPVAGKPLQINDRLELYNYEPHPSGTGEEILFPMKAKLTFFTKERTPAPMPFTSREIVIDSISFNGGVPDSIFSPRIPADFRVYDNINGLGWVEGSDPRLPDAVRSRSRRWLAVFVAFTVACFVSLGWWRFWSRRRNAHEQ